MKFKQGDEVYCPMIGTKIYKLSQGESSIYPIKIESDKRDVFDFSDKGIFRNWGVVPILHHATPDNKELLENLYGLEFEDPPQEMIKIGNFEFPKP